MTVIFYLVVLEMHLSTVDIYFILPQNKLTK